MRRRGMTVLIGAVLVGMLTVLVAQANVPYVQLEPGPTYDTLGKDDSGKDIIVVTGGTVTESKGQLRFVTVGVQPRLTLLQALIGWIRDDEAVVPRELIYPPDQSEKEVEQRNAEDFANSGSAAESAALAELGYKMRISVKDVSPNTPASGVLRKGDVIETVDGATVDTADKMLQLIRGKPAGTTLTFGLERQGVKTTVRIATVAGEDGVPRVGFTPELTSSAPFTLDIPIENVGGPSAGLMLALGIVDTLEPEDLTGGKIIAGTGTIDPAGAVGPIGGVPQKLIAAKDAGATFFLTPKDNCSEAVANAQPGLTLVRISSLDEALAALSAIRRGAEPSLCTS
jgi:PDZ domain-containing protein